MKIPSVAIPVILALLFAPPCARAATPTAADASRRNEEGVAAFSKGEFVAAADAFADVYRATGETKHLWNLALAESQAGRPFDALTHLRLYLSKPDATPKNIERARTIINDLTEQIGRLAAQIAHVTVVAPKGADVLLDGTPMGAAPLSTPIDVDSAKPHVITAQRGNDSTKQNLGPTAESAVRVELVFPTAPTTSSSTQAQAQASATAAAPTAMQPTPAKPSAEGTHGASSARTWLTVGLAVGAAGALGGGIAMGLASNSNATSAQQVIGGLPSNACANPTSAQTTSCGQIRDYRSSESTDNTVSVALYAGAGVLAAGALAAFLFVPHGESAQKRGAIVPLVGPGLAGAGYMGAF